MEEEFKSFMIDLDISEEQYVDFNIFHSTRTAEGRSTMRKMRILIPIIMCLCMWVTLTTSETDPEVMWMMVVPWVIVFALMEIFMTKIMEALVRRNLKRIKKEGKLPFTEHSVLIFEEDRLVQEHDEGTIVVQKERILRVYDEKDCYYVYFGALQAVIIPKKDTVGHEEEIRAYFNLK